MNTPDYMLDPPDYDEFEDEADELAAILLAEETARDEAEYRWEQMQDRAMFNF
jgi:hypothetical protein